MLNVINIINTKTGNCTLDLAILRSLVILPRPVSWYTESKNLFGIVKRKMRKKRIGDSEYIFCYRLTFLRGLAIT